MKSHMHTRTRSTFDKHDCFTFWSGVRMFHVHKVLNLPHVARAHKPLLELRLPAPLTLPSALPPPLPGSPSVAPASCSLHTLLCLRSPYAGPAPAQQQSDQESERPAGADLLVLLLEGSRIVGGQRTRIGLHSP
eukprot:21580-Hanusia_phi.AAC.2